MIHNNWIKLASTEKKASINRQHYIEQSIQGYHKTASVNQTNGYYSNKNYDYAAINAFLTKQAGTWEAVNVGPDGIIDMAEKTDMKGMLNNAWNTAKSTIENGYNAGKDMVNRGVDYARNAYFGTGSGSGSPATAGGGSNLPAVRPNGTPSPASGTAGNTFTNAVNYGKDLMVRGGNAISTGLQNAGTAVSETASNTANAVSNFFTPANVATGATAGLAAAYLGGAAYSGYKDATDPKVRQQTMIDRLTEDGMDPEQAKQWAAHANGTTNQGQPSSNVFSGPAAADAKEKQPQNSVADFKKMQDTNTIAPAATQPKPAQQPEQTVSPAPKPAQPQPHQQPAPAQPQQGQQGQQQAQQNLTRKHRGFLNRLRGRADVSNGADPSHIHSRKNMLRWAQNNPNDPRAKEFLNNQNVKKAASIQYGYDYEAINAFLNRYTKY